MKKQLDSQPSPQQDKTPAKPEPAEVAPKEEDVFSNVEPPLPVDAGFTDPSDILLFANSDDESQSFLLSQMRLNDEFTAELESLERRRRESCSRPLQNPFPKVIVFAFQSISFHCSASNSPTRTAVSAIQQKRTFQRAGISCRIF